MSEIRIGTAGYTYSWLAPLQTLKLKGERALQLWHKFSNTLDRINNNIDFWLFKMPPSFKYSLENLQTVKEFFNNVKLNNKAVLEFREPSWWKAIDKIRELGVIFCSVEATGLPRSRIVSNDPVYLRTHGYKRWYIYIYSESELDTVALSFRRLKADKKAIYLNNDHGMPENGLYLLKNLGSNISHNTFTFYSS